MFHSIITYNWKNEPETRNIRITKAKSKKEFDDRV